MNKAFRNTLRDILHDGGLVIFLIIVPLIYSLLYAFIYSGETVREVPIAVVDESGTARSRDFLRRLDATPDVRIAQHALSLDEGKRSVAQREVYGVVHLPSDFNDCLARLEQAHVSVFVDMSGMLYYKAILTSATDVSLDMNADLKVERAGNTTARQDEITAAPLRYEQVALFNPQSGFATFLIPAVLVLIIQQTLLLGVGMEAGTRRERLERSHHFPETEEFTLDARHLIKASDIAYRAESVARRMADRILHRTTTKDQKLDPRAPQPHHASRRAWRALFGRAAAFFLLEIPVTFYCLFVVPRIFGLPQIGNPVEILLFATPFLLSAIFFAITIGSLPRNRESIILLVVFSSVPMLFLTGVSWPGSAFPWYWKTLSCFIPSTFGVNGFVRLNTMGAHLPDVRPEYLALWLQTAIYLLTAWWVTRKNELLKISLHHYRQAKGGE